MRDKMSVMYAVYVFKRRICFNCIIKICPVCTRLILWLLVLICRFVVKNNQLHKKILKDLLATLTSMSFSYRYFR